MSDESFDSITLAEFLARLYRGRWLIIGVIILGTGISASAAFLLPKKYEATVVISPVSTSSANGMAGGLGALTSQFSGIASLAGISPMADNKRSESLATLQSEALTEKYIERENLLPILFKSKWDAQTRQWRIDKWQKPPTVWAGNRYFKSRVRSVATDSKTGLVTLSITWPDPNLAAKWANDLVAMANAYLRDKAIHEADLNIAYLNDQERRTDLIGVKQGIYSLLLSEINKAMLARGSDEFALKVIDPAVPPESPSSPNPSIWIASGFVASLFLGLLGAMLMPYRLSPSRNQQ